MRFLRTSLPPTVVVLPEPVPPVTAVTVAPTTDRLSVERFSIRSLPPSFEARILSVRPLVPLIVVTRLSMLAWPTSVAAYRKCRFDAGDSGWPAFHSVPLEKRGRTPRRAGGGVIHRHRRFVLAPGLHTTIGRRLRLPGRQDTDL